jgi:hypothetical protein
VLKPAVRFRHNHLVLKSFLDFFGFLDFWIWIFGFLDFLDFFGFFWFFGFFGFWIFVQDQNLYSFFFNILAADRRDYNLVRLWKKMNGVCKIALCLITLRKAKNV